MLKLLIEKCCSMNQLKTIHAQIIIQGLTQDVFSLSKLISLSALSSFGDLQYACYMFDKIPQKNRHMYNNLIRASSIRHSDKAILLYKKMVCSWIYPNEFTFPFILKACASGKAYLEGIVVHGHALKLGFSESHDCVQNGLINFYVGCGNLECAREVFDCISIKTLVSWNSMIGGYTKMGLWKDAFFLFDWFREEGFNADGHTFVNLLSVCSKVHDIRLGRFVHWYIAINGINADIFVQNSLLDMYAKCGHLQTADVVFNRMTDKNVVSWTSMVSAYAKHGYVDYARTIFDKMPMKNVVSWNSMISCYLQHGLYMECLGLFLNMRNSFVLPDETTIIFALSACSQLGDLDMGNKLHSYARENIMKPTAALYNSLLDMYAKCSSAEIAHDFFRSMPERNIVSWNVIINTLALHGYGHKAIELFKEMEACHVQPDAFTLSGMLSACGHCGLVEMGRFFFNKIGNVYNVPYDIEHYACMIDILGRAGLLNEALELVGNMVMKPDVVIWGALLGACRIHKNVRIAKLVLKQLLELEFYNGGLFVLMSNILCEAERWDDMKRLRNLMEGKGVRKNDAVSSIEIEGRIHDFIVDNKTHVALNLIPVLCQV